jgi:HK97 family phage portal protein
MGYLGLDSASGMPVNAYTALTVSALWRGLMTVSSAIAGMPLATMREWGATRSRVSSWLDDPGQAVGYKPFSWKQTSVLHFILGGDSFQRHLYNGLGMIAGLEPINPNAVNVYWDDSRPGGKRYEVSLMRDGKMCRETYDKSTMTQVMGPTLDGLRGLGLIDVARTSVGGALAADMASARTFRHGPMVAAVAVPQDELQEGDAEKVQAIIDDRVGGVENAGRVVVLERKYDLKPFGMTNKDAQFLESREFSIYEAARWLGVHPVFLMDPKAVSTWGTGVEILQRGLGRFTLPQYTDPFQEAMTALLPNKSWAEFNFKALERGSPADEIDLIIKQVDGGLLTINQALALVNQPSIGPAGDVLRLHGEPLNPEVGEPVSPTSAIPAPDVAPTNAQLHEMLMGDSR